MSQRIVYDILRELGGRATTAEIVRAAKHRFTEKTAATVVSKKLWIMKGWGLVDREVPPTPLYATKMKKPIWFIVAEPATETETEAAAPVASATASAPQILHQKPPSKNQQY